MQETETPDDAARLIEAAVTKAREGVDYPAFADWLRTQLASEPSSAGAARDADENRRADLTLARCLWRLIPLESNGYRGNPLPEPGRNDPCYCGSGRKYKQCCQRSYQETLAALDPGLVWSVALRDMLPATVAELVGKSRVPLWALRHYAADLADDDRFEDAVACLEPLFDPPLRCHDEEAAALLDDLAGLYGELGDFESQYELLTTVAQQAPPSPLRAEALYCTAGLLADEGAWDDAEATLQAAIEDAPEDPRFGVLDIRLLVATGAIEEARSTAAVWQAVAMAQLEEGDFADADGGADPDAVADRDELVAFYTEAARDPEGVVLAATLGAMPEEEAEFLNRIAQACERPLPHYALAPVDGPTAGDVTPDARVLLVTPAGFEDLEREWRQVFPVAKPVGDADEPADTDDTWGDGAWYELLTARPEAWDSLWVLDDLATAIAFYEAPGVVTWTRRFRVAVLERAAAIVRLALGPRPLELLPWECPENRPALRSLRRLEALSAADM